MLTWILSSSVLILAVLGLRLLFRGRISQRMVYGLWALVLLRLLIPGSMLQSAFSVANMVSEFTAPPVFSAPVLEQEEALEQVLTEHQITQTDFDVLPVTQQNTYTQQADALVESSRMEAQAEIQKQETRYYSTRQILMILWILGAAITAGCLLWANIRFGLALSRSRRRVAPAVYRSAATESPCLFGLFRPAVYLPEDLSEEDVPYVLAHEQTHLRHLDHIWSALRCLCLALHWFNPLVWIAVKVSRTDSELACDEGALERLGDESRESYGKVLIRMSRGKNGNLLLTATTMTADKRTLYARVKAIAKKPRILAAAVVLLALTAAIIVGCTFTGPESPADPTEPPETTEPTAPPETTAPVETEPEIELPWNMWSVLEGEAFELDYQNHYIMALENVEVKYIPSDAAETIYELHNELVKIYAAVRGEPENWVLVRYASTNDGGGTMGWVKISGLTEYTEERKAQLRFPVSVREGTKDVETGKELMQTDYAQGKQEGEFVKIGNEMGIFQVNKKDIVYPSTQKTTDKIMGEWEAPREPAETTVTVEPTVIYEAECPSYDLNSKKNFVISQETYDGFRVDHVHVGTGRSGERYLYDDGYFWISTDETMWLRGNRYDLWAIEKGKLKKLDSKAISMEVTTLGKTLELNTEYVSDKGNITFTYIPAPENIYIASAEDSSRWVVHLLIENPGNNHGYTYHNWWVLLDPKTGEITEFMQNFDPAQLYGKDYYFVTWANGGFIARVYGEGYFFFDTEKGTITENYPYENPEEPGKWITFQRKGDVGRFEDPFDGEIVEFKMPEGWWATQWHQSYDGRKTAACLQDEQGRIRQMLVFDGETNRLYQIHRTGFSAEKQEFFAWSHDNCLLISTTEENREEISIYTFE